MAGSVHLKTIGSRSYILYLILNLLSAVRADVIQLTQANINQVFRENEVVFVNFYADWCRFSQILAPVFLEASNKIKAEFPIHGKIAFGKVDCDQETSISAGYHISKYPTLKLFRNGEIVKREFRGQRSADSIAAFIRDQITDPVQEHRTLEELDDLDTKKRHVIGYFASKESEEYKTFKKVASSLRDDCEFHAAFGPVSESERTGGSDNVVFRAPNTRRQDTVFLGQLTNYDYLNQWMTDKCVPLVREITFENAEELTEEGLPFLILFYNPDEKDIIDQFQLEVARQLLPEKANINFLTADGLKFTHPLHHLGKSPKDLPILAIDSFRHMYIFPGDIRQDMGKPGVLKQFIADLHSGKLHREFHHGPDPTEPPADQGQDSQPTGHIPHDKSDGSADVKPKQPTSPPESTFRKLAPSRNRYTILRDEL
ncbi:endoplasmic reticulum resident protein 44-like [Liolophura sinensis]|uniref:endoplasmic reticulum resident protein 44-like n=1 Tax=Liolophura sinensis TaxID=3198878 RepID=UPI0031589137